MLKVLQLIPTLDRSGAEKQMVLLAQGLPRDRFDVAVAALTRLGPFETELNAAGIPVTLIGKRFKADPLALKRLTAHLRAGRYDVIQTWIYAANTYGRLAARIAGTPVVVTAEMAVDLWKSKRELAIDHRLARWTDRIVGNSQAVVDFYAEKASIPREKLACIPSGIGPEEPPQIDRDAVRAELNTPADAPVALFIGRLAQQKGIDILLRSLDLLQHIRPNLVTWIAGEGPERARLEEEARALELLGTRVRFLGHREDAPRLLAAADMLILPSRYEGLPNVVMEAMRFRKPVVATSAPGTTDLVQDRQTGRLVPVDDFKTLAQAIRDLLDDPEEARRYGEAGRALVDQHFTAQAMVDRYAALYEQLAAGEGNSQIRT